MASGSWTFNTQNTAIQGMVKWYSKSNGTAQNSSHVGIVVYFKKTNTGYSLSGTVNTYGTITSGSQKSELNYNITLTDANTWTIAYAKEWDVNHNNDGSKQIEIHIWGNANFSLKSFDTKKTVTLDKIARYTSIKKWEVAEVGKTYVKLNWQTADTIDWLCTYLNDSSQWTNITSAGGISKTSGSFTYKGMASSGNGIPSTSTLKPGTTYKIKLWVRRKDTGLGTYSSNISFTTKPVSIIGNVNQNFFHTVGDDIPLIFKDYSENKSWISLEIQNTNKVWEQIIKTDEVISQSEYLWKVSDYADTLYAKLSTRNSAPMRIRSGTTISENGQTISCITSEFVGTANIRNSNPTFEDFYCAEENNLIQNVLNNPLCTLQNYGTMHISVPSYQKAVAKNGATIAKYHMKIEGISNIDKDFSPNEIIDIPYVTPIYSTSGEGKISFYAVDSRGNQSETISKTFTVLPYKVPTLTSLNLKRLNDYEPEVVLDFQGAISKLVIDGKDKNTDLSVSYQYVESGTELSKLWNDISGIKVDSDSSETQHLFIFAQNTKENTFGVFGEDSEKIALDSNKSYVFDFSVSDSFMSTHYTASIEQGIPIMYIGDNGQVSIDMIPDITRAEKFQVNSDILVVDKDENKIGLLSEIRKMMYGTDWINVTMKNGSTTPNNSNALSVKKHGNIVYMMGWLTVTSQKAGTVIANIPDGYRPVRHFRQLVPRYDTRFGNIGISVDGEVTMVHDTNLDESSKVYYIDMTWVTSSNSADFSSNTSTADLLASDKAAITEATI